MSEFQIIVNQLVSIGVSPKEIKQTIKKAFVLDTSGSTSRSSKNSKTILCEEKQIVINEMLDNKNGINYFFTFSQSYDRKKNYYGQIMVDPDIDFVMLPDGLISSGGTETASPLEDIVKLLQTKEIELDEITIITDGETNSYPSSLISVVTALRKYDIKINIFAVTNTNTDFNKIRANEGDCLIGMDLIKLLQNQLYKYTIQNNFHYETPFLGAINSNIDVQNITYFDIPLPSGISIHMFIWSIIDHLHPNINWRINDFTRMCVEFGKLLSIFNHTYSFVNDFVLNISNEIKKKTESVMDTGKICKFIQYGFNCARNKKSIILSAAEERVEIEATEKRNQFSNAISDLEKKGTTLGCSQQISLSPKCIIIDNNTIVLPVSLGRYPNSMSGDRQLVFFGINETSSPELEQAIRIAFREYCNYLGYPNSRDSPAVIFHTLNLMSLIMIKSDDLTFKNKYINELQKIGIIQTKQNRMIEPKKYGESFYALWKKGIIPSIHHSRKDTHLSLYKDRMINPLHLEEPIWWALMMCMLGLFDEQLQAYHLALNLLGIAPNKEAFLNYMRRNYSLNIKGNILFETFEQEQTSIITFEPFPDDVEVIEVKPHTTELGDICNPKLQFTHEEILKCNRKCLYCRTSLEHSDFYVVNRTNNNEKLQNILGYQTPLKV
jgi:hypothetical protein